MTAIAIDFGSCNTLIAQWNDVAQQPEILTLPAISTPNTFLIPSVLYFRDATHIDTNRIAIGNQVFGSGHTAGENGYFDRIKRSLLVDPDESLHNYSVNGIEINAQFVGKLFLQQIFKQLRSQNIEITDLIFTAPVQAYERYLRWLESCKPDLMDISGFDGDIRIIDEPTAAALGYAISTPNSLVLVIDFGGGTLDICLVRTPKVKNLNEWGEVIGDRDLIYSEVKIHPRDNHKDKQVEVIAKTGLALGGSDIDRWLLEDYIHQQNLSLSVKSKSILLSLMERIKVNLSDRKSVTEIFYDPENLQAWDVCYDRSQLELILKEKGFYRVLQNAINEVINAAVAKGILKMDLKHIVLVGGSSLIPSVQELIRNAFSRATVHSDRPFEAVIYGALLLNQGLGIRDHLFHDYAIRYLSSSMANLSELKSEKITEPNEAWHYQPIFLRGQAYPTRHPFELILRATQADQTHIDLVIGELEKRSLSSVEVMFVGDRLVSEVNNSVTTKFLPLTNLNSNLNSQSAETPQLIIPLQPPGQIGRDRLQVIFQISDRRELTVTVIDLETGIELFTNRAIAELF